MAASFPVREERRGHRVEQLTPSKRKAPEGGKGDDYGPGRGAASDDTDGVTERFGKVALLDPTYDEQVVRGSADDTLESVVSDHRKQAVQMTNRLSADLRRGAMTRERLLAYFAQGAIPLVTDREYLVDRAVRLVSDKIQLRGFDTQEYRRRFQKVDEEHKNTVACIIVYREVLTAYGIPVPVRTTGA